MNRPTISTRAPVGLPAEELTAIKNCITEIATGLGVLAGITENLVDLHSKINGKGPDDYIDAVAGDVTIPVPVSHIMSAKQSQVMRQQATLSHEISLLYNYITSLITATTPTDRARDAGVEALRTALEPTNAQQEG